MTTDTKVPEGTGTQSDDKNQQQTNEKSKMYEESYVKEIIADRDKAKEKLRKMESDTEKAKKDAEEASLKAKGDYEALTKLTNEKVQKALDAAKAHIVNSFLAQLAVKHGLNDPSDIALFNSELELDDDFAIKNASEIEKQFEDFKKKKPYLFKTEEKKPVPKTDNLPFRKPTQEQSKDSKKPLTPLADILATRVVKN